MFSYLIVLTLWISPGRTSYDIDDGILYKLNFRGSSSSSTDEDLLLRVPNLETVIMTTNNDEQYSCVLPPITPASRDADREDYSGPNPVKLLEKLFVSTQCSYRIEAYWTYELCHGQYLKQFHVNQVSSSSSSSGEGGGGGGGGKEYYLGRFSKEEYDRMEKEWTLTMTDKKPPTIKIENINMPYLEIIMKDGTVCDINGQPRITRVLYVCYPSGKHDIFSFKEASTCEYEAVILSPLLCQHPDFRSANSNERFVNCSPLDSRSPTTPKNLFELQEESQRLKNPNAYEAEWSPGSGPGNIKIKIKPVSGNAEPMETEEEEEQEEEEEEEEGGVKKGEPKKDHSTEKSRREPFKPMTDPEVTEQFLLGEYCLYGGSGWWKYEFCYGKSVIQFHEDKSANSRSEILLGIFNLDKHLDWIQENPQKRPKPFPGRKYVSHFYSEGDMCDLTGKPRHVEVKLKCKKTDALSAVTLYLLEPKTCEYILGVESPIVCDVLHLADGETGLMHIKRDDFKKTKQVVPSDDYKYAETTVTSQDDSQVEDDNIRDEL